MAIYADIAGFAGSALILAAFAYVNLLKRAPDLRFNLLNFFVAGLLGGSLLVNYNLPALLLESAWMVIAATGIISALRQEQR